MTDKESVELLAETIKNTFKLIRYAPRDMVGVYTPQDGKVAGRITGIVFSSLAIALTQTYGVRQDLLMETIKKMTEFEKADVQRERSEGEA